MRLSAIEIGQALGLSVPAPVGEATGVSTDTRTIVRGDLFVALAGERFDGHDHIHEAFKRGAWAVVSERSASGGPVFLVRDSLQALGALARAWRSKLKLPIIAITGSHGKTTTRDMTALALSPLGLVARNLHNENNEIGVPQTLLRLAENDQAAVIEMGMRDRGQIAYLAGIALPRVGLITAIGDSHIELLGSRDQIAEAKAELLDRLPVGGTAILNSDDPYFGFLSGRSAARVLSFGFSERADVRAVSAERVSEGWRVRACTPSGKVQFEVHSPARHDVGNALSALATALVLDVSLEAASRALEGYAPGGMRMETLRSHAGSLILADCYNAAPATVRSALQTLSELDAPGRRIAFLGDMKELGEHAPQLHREISAAASALGITEVYAVGPLTSTHFEGVSGRFMSSEEAAEFAREQLGLSEGDVVLVKGSRAMRMERIVEALGS